ncbi:MAG: hypothetical protein ACKV2V_07765 [Blastocatellia bacterium]
MNKSEIEAGEFEYPHWNRVYAAVIVTLIVVITALWLFSRTFS